MRLELSYILDELTDHELVKVSDYISGMIIVKSLNKETLEEKDINAIKDIVDGINHRYTNKDFVSLIMTMKDVMREGSHGAVILDRAYVSKRLYKEIARESEIPEKTAISVCGVKVLVSDDLVENRSVIGIGRPKYDGVPARSLVIRGNNA